MTPAENMDGLNFCKPYNGERVDGENNLIGFDEIYTVSDIAGAIDELKSLYGDDLRMVPISGRTAGGGVFQSERDSENAIVIGLKIQTKEPDVQFLEAQNIELNSLKINGIVIDEKGRQIYAGAGVSLDQINQALKEKLGSKFKVLGADLTSYMGATVGATFMTGGMGPQRRSFGHESVKAIALHNGESITEINGADLKKYAGTYGWTGMVSAVSCEFAEVPEHEFGFSLPVNNTPESLGELVEHFAPFCRLEVEKGKLVGKSHPEALILGIELITLEALEMLLEKTTSDDVRSGAKTLIDQCKLADTDALVFVNGQANDQFGDILEELMGASEFAWECSDNFSDNESRLDLMKLIREGAPTAARGQKLKGAHGYKDHTDINTVLPDGNTEESMRKVWEAYQNYRNQIEKIISLTSGLNGDIQVYGHINPEGIDPHYRVTLASDDLSILNEAKRRAADEFKLLLLDLVKACELEGVVLTGGEKESGSDGKIIEALCMDAAGKVDLEKLPTALREKYLAQRQKIAEAATMFNWRAFPVYKGA